MMHSILTMGPGNALRCLALPGLLAFVLLCGYLNIKLRQIAERRRLDAQPSRPGRHFPLYLADWNRRPRHRIDSSRHMPPLQHVHEIRLDRCAIKAQANGSLLTSCAFQGCKALILLDRELALKALRFLAHRGHQVLVLHLMDPGEQHLSGVIEARFQDPETGQSVILRPQDWAGAYDRTVKESLAAWRIGLRRHGIAYEVVTTDTPFGTALRQALVRATGVA